jgi:hypothetical protein
MKRLILLPLVALVSSACGELPTPSDPNVSEPEDAALVTAGKDATLGMTDLVYGGCPTPEQVCTGFHADEGAVPTGWCAYGDCFGMTAHGEFRRAAEEIKVIAGDELGAFPEMWFGWHDGTLWPPEGFSFPCVLTDSGNKTRITYPEGANKCIAVLETSQHFSYEHFVSNPVTGCLGWVECRVY